MRDLSGNSLFPLKLFLNYALFVGAFPTIIFWMDFANLEETEECWDRDLVLSVLVSVPLVVSTWAALRNVRKVPILASSLALLTSFHLGSTGMTSYDGFLGEPFSDSGLSADAFRGYAFYFGISPVPFLVSYVVWYF